MTTPTSPPKHAPHVDKGTYKSGEQTRVIRLRQLQSGATLITDEPNLARTTWKQRRALDLVPAADGPDAVTAIVTDYLSEVRQRRHSPMLNATYSPPLAA